MRKSPESPEPAVRWITTSLRLRADQHEALRRAALERALARGGKMDSSEIVRELIDRWMKEGAR